MSEPMTQTGLALAERFPFKFTEQTCCPYPHDEDSGPDIEPRHLRSTKTERRTDAITAIEREARAALLDELEAAVRGLELASCGGYGCEGERAEDREQLLALIQQHREEGT